MKDSKDINSKWAVVGNEHIVEFLAKSIKNKNVAGAYIFSGPDNLGKNTLAKYFAQVLLCEGKGESACGKCASCIKFKDSDDQRVKANDPDSHNAGSSHSDLFIIEKEEDKKNISIEQVRAFIRQLSMSSFLNSYKIGIINDADTLSIEASNALLKTLEEPEKDVVIILTTSRLETMPQTIVSRSQVLRFNLVKSDKIYDYLIDIHKITRSAAKNFSRLALGRPAIALKFIKDKDYFTDYVKKAEIFLNFFQSDINGRLLGVKEITGEKASGQESVRTAREAIKIWQGLVRDLFLLELGMNDLMRNEVMSERMMKIKSGVDKTNLLKIAKSLGKSEDYLSANVNAKLVLEKIAINI